MAATQITKEILREVERKLDRLQEEAQETAIDLVAQQYGLDPQDLDEAFEDYCTEGSKYI